MKRRDFFQTVAVSGALAALTGTKVGTEPVGGRIAGRLQSMGIVLPDPPRPVATYVPFRKVGDIVYIAGQGPAAVPEVKGFGRVGSDLSAEEGYGAARAAGLNILAQMQAACDGDLDRVSQVVKLGGFVNSADGFTDQPKVINGASDLMVEVFGDAGLHARFAVGVNTLPFNVAVEIEALFEVRG